ncbi:MAG: Hpt domain-containing protein [Bacteroidota bacterium]
MKTDLNYLREMSGEDPGLMSEMIDIFKEQVVEMEAEMQALYDNGDYSSLGKLAHKAKTSVAIMGMDNLAKQLKDLEIQSKEGINVNNYQSFIDNFRNETKEAIIELTNFRKKLS